MYVEMSRW